MSGAGRKSQYRKGITSQYLDSDDLDLAEGDRVAQVVANRGAHVFSVTLQTGEELPAKLPNKFHKTIWLKPRDYVIVEGDESLSIKHILSKENIKNLKKAGQWPDAFHAEGEDSRRMQGGGGVVMAVDPLGDYQYEEEEEYEEEGEETEEAPALVDQQPVSSNSSS